MAKPNEQTPAVFTSAEFDGADMLKAMRKALGLSQEKFAELVGMKRQQLSAYENSHHSPGLDTLADIAEKAGLQIEVKIWRRGRSSGG